MLVKITSDKLACQGKNIRDYLYTSKCNISMTLYSDIIVHRVYKCIPFQMLYVSYFSNNSGELISSVTCNCKLGVVVSVRVNFEDNTTSMVSNECLSSSKIEQCMSAVHLIVCSAWIELIVQLVSFCSNEGNSKGRSFNATLH